MAISKYTDEEKREVAVTMFEFCSEHYAAFCDRYEERTGEALDEDKFAEMEAALHE